MVSTSQIKLKNHWVIAQHQVHWTGGGSNKGFLALYDVYHGHQKKILYHDSSCYSLSKSVLDRDGYDSVYAQGGADLRNDEFIIYDGKQCTISYLIEFQ